MMGLLATTHVDDLVGAHALHDVEVALDAAHVLGRIKSQVVEVEAGAEGLAFARQNDSAAILVQANLDKEVVELAHLLVRHGIEVARVIERADVNRTALLDQQFFVLVVELRQMIAFLIYAHWFQAPFPVFLIFTF